MEWYLGAWRKYATFTGRARRKEYWMFFLFNLIVSFVLAFAESFVGLADERGNGPLGTLYSLAVFLPSLAVGVRRMHDTDHSGWWIIAPFINLIFALTPGTEGSNRFGSDPKSTLQAYMPPAPPAWRPDPAGRHQYRYWDGLRWTDAVADGGVTATDPV